MPSLGGTPMRILRFSPIPLWAALAAFPAPQEPNRGAVIETVVQSSEAAKAGLQAGDLVLAWSAETGPRGEIESPFDLTLVGMEYGPRGVVTLQGERAGQPHTWKVNPSTPLFRITVRPHLPAPMLKAYREAVAAGHPGALERLRALATQVTASDPPWLAAWLLYRGAELAAEARDTAGADEGHRLAHERAAAAPPFVRAEILASWGRYFMNRDWGKARNLVAAAMAEYRKVAPESLAAALMMHSLGEIGSAMEQYAEAEPHYREALTIAQKLAPGTLAEAYHLNNAGSLAIRRNQLIKADELFRRALAIREAIAPDTTYAVLHNLGAVAYSQHDYTAAENYYEQSLAELRRLDPASSRQTVTLGNLATVAAARGDPAKAAQYHEQSLAIVQKTDPGSFTEAHALGTLGAMLLGLGKIDEAERLQLRSLELRSKLAPDSLMCAATLTRLGTIAATRGDWAQAEKYHRQALAIRERIAPGGLDHADSLLRTGAALRMQGRPAEAAKLFGSGLEMLERSAESTDGASLAEARAIFAGNYRDYIEILIDQNEPEQAYNALERSKARALLALLAERRLPLAAGVPPALEQARRQNFANFDRIQDQLLRLSPGTDAARIESLLGRLRALDVDREQIAEQIRKADPRLASIEYPQPLNVAQARRALDPGTYLLSYSVGESRTTLFVVTPEDGKVEFAARTIAAGEKDLEARVEQFRRLLQDRASDRVALAAKGHELYDLLVKPAEDLLAGAERVLIAPDGPLQGIPFAALMRGGNQYLVEWKPLHTVQSATVYAELKKLRHPARAEPIRLLAFGDPRSPSQSDPEFQRNADALLRAAVHRGLALGRLPFSRDEVTGIAGLFSPSTVQLQAQASEESAKSLMSRARFIHFATHAIFDDRLPLNSALVLSIPDKRSDGQENGLLQAWEIFEQVRLDADLVVLSACQTGLGKELSGEGLIGLTRAFQYAGAHSVVASLWSVDDRRTADLMRRFYTSLRGGASKDVALQTAQREMIRSTASHPFYWAAFTLSGDWR